MKKFLVSLFAVLISVTAVFAGDWVQNGDGWQYMEGDELITSQQKKIDGNYYYFDEAGYLLTGYQEIDDKFYAFNNDGTPMVGPIAFAGKSFTVTNKGEIKNITKLEFESLVENNFITNTGELAGDLEYAKKLADALPISKVQLRTILTAKGITTDKIDYVMNNVNVNWKEHAAKCAKYVKKYTNIGKKSMKNILLRSQFTEEEAMYGVNAAVSEDNSIAELTEQEIANILSEYQKEVEGLFLAIK